MFLFKEDIQIKYKTVICGLNNVSDIIHKRSGDESKHSDLLHLLQHTFIG